MKPMRQKLFFAASCLVCAVVSWRSVLRFEGTEFGSGSLAGDEGVGAFVFIVAAGLIHKYPRSAALSGLAGTYFSLPLFLYLVFPRPFRQVFSGNWTDTRLPRESFSWDEWWIAGILLTVVVAYIGCGILIRSLVARCRRNRQMSLQRQP
jgi:hypothetical protein